jgi:flotillin
MKGYTLWFLISLVFIFGPFIAPSFIAGFEMSNISQFVLLVIGVISLLILSILVVITKLYQKTAANESLIRTGMRGMKVIMDGGIIFVPVLHKILRISLETMRLDVIREGNDALITSDYLRADLKSEFYIKVQPEKNDIINAARSLGEKSVNAQAVKDLVFDKLVSALRTVAAKSTLFDLNSNREQFARDVKSTVEDDLRHNGLTLESVTVSKLDQADLSAFNKQNVFDAQGRKRVAEITATADVETNKLQRVAEQNIEAQNVDTKKKVLTLQYDEKRAEAEQDRDVQKARSEAKRQADEFAIEQQEAVAIRDILKNKAVEVQDVEKQKTIEIAGQQKETEVIEALKTKEVANIEREKATEVAAVERNRSIEVAKREKEIQIAAKEEQRAKAESARLAAETLREQNEQNVETVKIVESAKREKEKQVIAAQAQAEKEFISTQRLADAEAYQTEKLAQGKMAAAEADYQAKVKAAEGDKEAAAKRAEGMKAEQMVPVEVAAKQVEVDRTQAMIEVDVAEKKVAVAEKQVAVDRKSLEQKEEFGRAAIDFEIKKLSIEQNARIQMANAQAFATILQKVNMTVYGSNDMLNTMVTQFQKAMGVNQFVEGLFSGAQSGEAPNILSGVLGKATDLVDGFVSLLKGRGVKDEDAQKMVKMVLEELRKTGTTTGAGTPATDGAPSPTSPTEATPKPKPSASPQPEPGSEETTSEETEKKPRKKTK